MSSRLRKQNRILCGHCNEYLSRGCFWRHRRTYYDVKNQRWTTKDIAENLESEAKRARHELGKDTTKGATAPGSWSFSSSEDEDLEAAISTEGMNDNLFWTVMNSN